MVGGKNIDPKCHNLFYSIQAVLSFFLIEDMTTPIKVSSNFLCIRYTKITVGNLVGWEGFI